MTFRHVHLSTSNPVRARLDDGMPVLKFIPLLEGIHDITPAGTPVEQAAWLRQLAEVASDLAIRVERNAAGVTA